MLILLSPSKTQELGKLHVDHSEPEFMDKAEKIVTQLQGYSAAELAELMTMSSKLGEATHKRFTAFSFPPSRENCRQALLAFRGDVFSEIRADEYSVSDFAFAQAHLRILSGLYGILRPLDLIQPYRLEMGGKFAPHQAKNLYHYWRKDITSSISGSLSTMKNGVLLNLASGEYFKAVEKKSLQSPIVDIHFKEQKGGKLRTVAIHAKRARGALANYIIQNRAAAVSELRGFEYNGYVYHEGLSTEKELYYIR